MRELDEWHRIGDAGEMRRNVETSDLDARDKQLLLAAVAAFPESEFLAALKVSSDYPDWLERILRTFTFFAQPKRAINVSFLDDPNGADVLYNWQYFETEASYVEDKTLTLKRAVVATVALGETPSGELLALVTRLGDGSDRAIYELSATSIHDVATGERFAIDDYVGQKRFDSFPHLVSRVASYRYTIQYLDGRDVKDLDFATRRKLQSENAARTFETVVVERR